jgi:hypothetical protein
LVHRDQAPVHRQTAVQAILDFGAHRWRRRSHAVDIAGASGAASKSAAHSLEEKPALGFVAEAKLLRGGRGNLPADQIRPLAVEFRLIFVHLA